MWQDKRQGWGNQGMSRNRHFGAERPMARDKADNICVDEGLIPADRGRTVEGHWAWKWHAQICALEQGSENQSLWTNPSPRSHSYKGRELGTGLKGVWAPVSVSFPPTKLLSPIWEPRPGLELNDFEGPASLSPVPVHIDGVDLGEERGTGSIASPVLLLNAWVLHNHNSWPLCLPSHRSQTGTCSSLSLCPRYSKEFGYMLLKGPYHDRILNTTRLPYAILKYLWLKGL